MNGIGLSSRLQRIKDPNTVQIWKEVVKEYLTAISTTNTSNIGTSVGNDHCIVTTTLWQIVRGEHSLANIEHQLVSEQKTNHQVFEAFCNVIREATDMVRFMLFWNIWVIYYYTNLYQISGYFRKSILFHG